MGLGGTKQRANPPVRFATHSANSLKATVLSVEKGVAHARIEGTLKLKHTSLNFKVSPPAEIEEIAQMPLVGFMDFQPGTQRVLTLRLLADKATARNGQVEYAVALRSLPSVVLPGPNRPASPTATGYVGDAAMPR